MAENGNAKHLVPSHPDNTSAVKHGAWSRTGRVLAPRAEQITELLMQHPHAVGLDVVAAEEIGAVLAQIEAIDAYLEETGRRDRTRLMDLRLKLSRELRTWLREFGGTPKSRAEFARELAQGGLAAEIARRRAQQKEDV